jgi:hypothetical protein
MVKISALAVTVYLEYSNATSTELLILENVWTGSELTNAARM